MYCVSSRPVNVRSRGVHRRKRYTEVAHAVAERYVPQNLGEGAVPVTGNLLYIDAVRGNLFMWDPVARRAVRPRIELRQPIGTVIPVSATRVVAALMKGIARREHCDVYRS